MCVYLLIHVSWILAVLLAAGFRTLSLDCKQNTGRIVSWLSRESRVEAWGSREVVRPREGPRPHRVIPHEAGCRSFAQRWLWIRTNMSRTDVVKDTTNCTHGGAENRPYGSPLYPKTNPNFDSSHHTTVSHFAQSILNELWHRIYQKCVLLSLQNLWSWSNLKIFSMCCFTISLLFVLLL